MENLRLVVSDTQEKLGRTLKEEEIDFLEWMFTKHLEEQVENMKQPK